MSKISVGGQTKTRRDETHSLRTQSHHFALIGAKREYLLQVCIPYYEKYLRQARRRQSPSHGGSSRACPGNERWTYSFNVQILHTLLYHVVDVLQLASS